MNIRNYDDAVKRFYKKLKINPLPLSSWDFYGKNFDEICNDHQDITSLSKLANKNAWTFNNQVFKEELQDKGHVIVVTDVSLNIVYATKNIWKMNGYRPEQIIGKKPKMFQGEKTCEKSVRLISNAIREQKSFETIVTNYKKDGSTYKCWIHGQPVLDNTGKVVNFIAFEREVA